MNGDAKGIGKTDDQPRVSSVDDVSGVASGEVREAVRKNDPDAEWLSMATGDPALYLKDAE